MAWNLAQGEQKIYTTEILNKYHFVLEITKNIV